VAAFQSGSARLLPRIIAGRQAGPLFLADRRPAPARTPRHRRRLPRHRARTAVLQRAEYLLATVCRLSTACAGDADPVQLGDLGLHGVGAHVGRYDLIQHLITPTPGPAQRSALACADALRAAATRLADHDDAPIRWAPAELQHDHPNPTAPAESSSTAATMPAPSTDTRHSPAPQYPPGFDVSKYVRAPLAPQPPGRT
jgi:hypothetical protein